MVSLKLNYDWLSLKSRRSAVGGRRSAVGGQMLHWPIRFCLILVKLHLMITPSLFTRFGQKYYHSNPLIETILMSTKSQRLDYPFPKYLESSPIIIYMRYVNPN